VTAGAAFTNLWMAAISPLWHRLSAPAASPARDARFFKLEAAQP
jgi:hypothetical protein